MTKLLGLLMGGSLALAPTNCLASMDGDLFQLGSGKMKRICTSEQYLAKALADSLGYEKFRTSRDLETRAEDEFALRSAARLRYQIKNVRWQREVDGEGRCHLSLILLIPPDLAPILGGSQPLAGDVELRLRQANGEWNLASDFGDGGFPRNEFRDHFRSFVSGEARRQVDDFRRSEAERQQRETNARKQAAAEAEAAFKRDFPREWAAEQQKLRKQQEARRRATLERQAEEQRRATACEANGGTWGYKTDRFGRSSQLGCFFQISK
jgi:hypothetical protein